MFFSCQTCRSFEEAKLKKSMTPNCIAKKNSSNKYSIQQISEGRTLKESPVESLWDRNDFCTLCRDTRCYQDTTPLSDSETVQWFWYISYSANQTGNKTGDNRTEHSKHFNPRQVYQLNHSVARFWKDLLSRWTNDFLIWENISTWITNRPRQDFIKKYCITSS